RLPHDGAYHSGDEELIRRKDGREDMAPRSHGGSLWSGPVAVLNDMDGVFDGLISPVEDRRSY
ncbi:MAG TPA: hypothetical protein VMW88_04380, partial [Thermoplasmata archaeon]|nr:hypothetical protein [Thermoplasmata archaeon]